MFEARVIQEMFRLNDYEKLDLKYSYWRTNTDVEVDVIVSRGAGQPLAAIEIKSSTSPSETSLSGLGRFGQDYPKVPKYCVCLADRAFQLRGITIVPFRDLLTLLKKSEREACLEVCESITVNGG